MPEFAEGCLKFFKESRDASGILQNMAPFCRNKDGEFQCQLIKKEMYFNNLLEGVNNGICNQTLINRTAVEIKYAG